MKPNRTHIVLLSGGSGTRLWPLSNDVRSKQFLKVLRDGSGTPQSMVQRTFSMLNESLPGSDITIAACENQAVSIASQIEGDYELVLEPERRDTGPAIMLAVAHLVSERRAADDDVVIVMPIDAYADPAYYEKLSDLDRAVREGVADIVLLGVEPTCPSEKYGYIVPEERNGQVWPVSRFVEKPDEQQAEGLISQGALWNCGVFAFRAGYVNALAASYVEGVSFESLRERYDVLPKRSFDYEVVEKADSVAVVAFHGEWSDLGTWNALSEKMEECVSGRVTMDEGSCENMHAINELGLPMVVVGARDIVIVATPDGILVSSKEESARIKDLVSGAAENRPMYEKRRWGEYRVLDFSSYPDGASSLTKELAIKPGCQISHQRHACRSEVWTIVSGEGEVAVNGEVSLVEAGSVIRIPEGTLHALRAKSELRIIEVQLGRILAEEDIERFGDFWK